MKRHGFDALLLHVSTQETKSHRHYTEIRRMLEGGGLPPRVLRRSLAAFELLGRCEAEVHGTSLENVHFHEVGALDSIVDIVGTAWALEILNVERCHASVIPQGRGFVKAAHGILPIPAPATVRMLEGAPVRMTEIEAELTTPTGAALLRTLCETIGEPIGIRPRRTGVATGTLDLTERPNIVRAILGEPLAPHDSGSVEVFETTIDDMNPQLYGHLTESLFVSGAREVFLTPVQMKKGRPGVLVTAICDSGKAHAVLERLFKESTTIGVRVRQEGRVELMRSIAEVTTPLGMIRVKTAILPTGEERRMPEYEDVKRIAQSMGRPLVEVMDEVRSFLQESARTTV